MKHFLVRFFHKNVEYPIELDIFVIQTKRDTDDKKTKVGRNAVYVAVRRRILLLLRLQIPVSPSLPGATATVRIHLGLFPRSGCGSRRFRRLAREVLHAVLLLCSRRGGHHSSTALRRPAAHVGRLQTKVTYGLRPVVHTRRHPPGVPLRRERTAWRNGRRHPLPRRRRPLLPYPQGRRPPRRRSACRTGIVYGLRKPCGHLRPDHDGQRVLRLRAEIPAVCCGDARPGRPWTVHFRPFGFLPAQAAFPRRALLPPP